MMEPFGIDILIFDMATRAHSYKEQEPRSFERLERLRGGKEHGTCEEYRNDFSSTSQDKGIAEGMLQSTVWRANYG